MIFGKNVFFWQAIFFSKREFLASVTWSNFAISLGNACLTVQADKVFGILSTVFVIDPPKLVCRAPSWSHKWGLKDFHPDELKFYLPLSVSSAIRDHFLLQSREENQSSPK